MKYLFIINNAYSKNIFKLLFMNEYSLLHLFLHSKLCMPEHLQIKNPTSVSEVDCDIFIHVLGGRFQDQQTVYFLLSTLTAIKNCHQVEGDIFITARITTICPNWLRRDLNYACCLI